MLAFLRSWWFSLLCLGAFLGDAFGILHLGWPGLVALVLAGLPQLLPLVAEYVEELGAKGVVMRSKERSAIEVRQIQPASRLQQVPGSFETFSIEAQHVLSALWQYQRETFGDDFSKRWGFAVGSAAPNYQQFAYGRAELALYGLVRVDPRGYVFLADEGIKFCQDHTIPASQYYKEFSGA